MPEAEQKVASETFRNLTHANLFLRDSYNMMKEFYNRAYKDSKGDERKKLDDYKKEVEMSIKEKMETDPAKMKEFANLIEKGVKVLSNIHPILFEPLNDFLVNKASDTFGNVAFKSYKEFGEKAPIISIENPPIGSALSRAEDLKKLIEESRRKFANQLVEKNNMSRGDADRAAEKLIGATWDVGHINMLRKYGYESKDIIKEAEKIAPFVKHVHLSDNFGMEHTELPMGMGNVPIKEIMEKLGKQGINAKKIVEAASWWQHMKTAPLTQSLEAFGSPLYSMKAPYWNQAASTYGNYFAFPSAYMPEQHFSLYGGGFSSLPTELGGQVPGKQSRVSGTPME